AGAFDVNTLSIDPSFDTAFRETGLTTLRYPGGTVANLAGLIEGIEGRRVDGHRPWPRIVTTAQGWRLASERVASGTWTMLGLWGDPGAVHMAIYAGAGLNPGACLKPAPTLRAPPTKLRLSPSNARANGFRPSARCIRPRSAWSGRCATFTGSSRSD